MRIICDYINKDSELVVTSSPFYKGPSFSVSCPAILLTEIKRNLKCGC